jgi:hypothetical protein
LIHRSEQMVNSFCLPHRNAMKIKGEILDRFLEHAPVERLGRFESDDLRFDGPGNSAHGERRARSEDPMTQRALEAALGKLICDDAFRREFAEDAEGTIGREGFVLSPTELTSLYKIGRQALEDFARLVDDRVRRADLFREVHAGAERHPVVARARRRRSSGAQ